MIDNLAGRHRQGVPLDLNRIPAIHFGRLMIVRPEQYLLNSSAKNVRYFDRENTADTGGASAAASASASEGQQPADGGDTPPDRGNVPWPFDDFATVRRPSQASSAVRSSDFSSFLLTLVEFDGDIRVYMRDIAEYLAGAFDLIFENCEEFPGTRDFELFWLWIRRYQINTDLFYAPYPDLSVVRIKQLEEFKRRFDAFVAQVRSPQGARVTGLDDLFDAFLRENQQIARDFPTPGGLFRSSQFKGRR